MNHLSVQNGREIIFDSTDAVREDDSGSGDVIALDAGMLDLSALHKLVSPGDLESMEILPDFFPDFTFRAGDATERRNEPELVDYNEDDIIDAADLEDDGDLPEVDFGDHLQEQEKRLQEEQREMAFPAAATDLLDIPAPDFDDNSHHHGLGDAVDLMEVDDDQERRPIIANSPPRSPSRRKSIAQGALGVGAQVVDMFEVDNPLLKDYNYFDVNKLNGWSGPQHWKYRHGFAKKKAAPGVDGAEGDAENDNDGTVAEAAGVDRGRISAHAKSAAAEKKTASRTKKVAFSIDFSKPMSDEEFGKLFDGHSKSSTTLSKKTLSESERDSKALTLVADVGYDPEKLVSLFLKPSMKITNRRRRAGPRRNSLIGQHNADSNSESVFNAGIMDDDDQFDAGPADVHDDDDNPFANAPDVDMGSDIPTGSQDLGMGFSASQIMGTQSDAPIINMAALPQGKRVNEIKINYARVDKKIDVKKLKRAIWRGLCSTFTTRPSKATPAPPIADSMEQPKGWQEALSQLQNHDIDRATLEQVSVPYCFVCLLHLANERHLSLSAENLETLVIKQTAEGSDVPQADVSSVLFGGRKK